MIERLRQFVGEKEISLNEPMSRHTTFRTGGPASLFLKPGSVESLIAVQMLIREMGVPFYVLGNGSNLLISDRGYDGVMISTENLSVIRREDDDLIYAEAGALNSAIASFVRDEELTGFEFAAGIPGTIGGAMVMNAGAYGGEMKDIVHEVRVLTADGRELKLNNSACDFGYRTSVIKREKITVLSVLLKLQKGEKSAIEAQMKELALKRKEKQPLEYASAGSTFKRPEGYFAGKLIQDAGLRGFSVGDAQVSEKHCGFVINRGSATSSEIYELIQKVRDRVFENSGVLLEPEVIIMGDF